MTADPWLTVGEAAARLKVQPATVRRWAMAGTIPAHRVVGSRLIRFRTSEIDEALIMFETDRATDQ